MSAMNQKRTSQFVSRMQEHSIFLLKKVSVCVLGLQVLPLAPR